ncbi:imidazoleglycerol-phosphate dehydratase HisB [Archaeoglobales archaeon]|nr:MAG: imidazoleglycerol-phosphate dehydratase HisB [Archaeoglobales archaeon]
MARKGRYERKTKETDISVRIDLDFADYEISTPIPFFTHMLETLAKHSGIGIKLTAKGDVEVDEHHTVEDTAIAIGRALSKALGDKKGIERFGHAILPMDESVAICGVDVSGRGVFRFEGDVRGEIKNFKGENFIHFFDTLAREAGINIYLEIKGFNLHHKMEVGFKAFAVALKDAVKVSGEGVRSTKGSLG